MGMTMITFIHGCIIENSTVSGITDVVRYYEKL